jgi:hypothetical protein
MLNSLLQTIRFLILVFSGHKQVTLENVALRHQLAVFTREKKRPRLRDQDRLFWIALKKLWKDWGTALVFVQPETVIAQALLSAIATCCATMSAISTSSAADLFVLRTREKTPSFRSCTYIGQRSRTEFLRRG